jgi:hypothetical protein
MPEYQVTIWLKPLLTMMMYPLHCNAAGEKIGASITNYVEDFSAILAKKFGSWEKIRSNCWVFLFL